MKQNFDLSKMDLIPMSYSELQSITGGGFWKVFGIIMEVVGVAMVAASLIFSLGSSALVLGIATGAAGFVIQKDEDIIS